MPALPYLPRYTAEDYRQWEGDWELWSGIPVAMTPSPFGPHQAVAARLIRLLGNQLEAAGCDCQVLHELDWVVSDDTVVRPDVVIVCGAIPETHLHEAPVLIAEVLSRRTEHKDRGAKRELYRQQGVAHYLILDPHEKTVEVHQRTASGKYEQLDAAVPCRLELQANCQIILDLTKLFG